MRRIILLVDGIHTAELVAELDGVCRLADAELLLVYVRGHSPRQGLDLVRRRPGGVGMPPHRQRVIEEAEEVRGAHALEEAERRGRELAGSVRRIEVEGEAGRRVVDVASRERPDLIAVRAGRGRLGPAARFIADHADCSVLLLAGR